MEAYDEKLWLISCNHSIIILLIHMDNLLDESNFVCTVNSQTNIYRMVNGYRK